jgi:hypothetical protein
LLESWIRDQIICALGKADSPRNQEQLAISVEGASCNADQSLFAFTQTSRPSGGKPDLAGDSAAALD